jgi:UDP-N-acetylmuramate dehydrogenase
MIDIKENVILAPYTTFRIGGPAKFFMEVVSEEELIEALKYAMDNQLQFFVLGGGSNVLFSDKGYNGLVIHIKMNKFSIDTENNEIIAGAGISIAKLIKVAVNHSLSGLEWSAGLPGGLGGAIRGNAGTFGLSMRDVIKSVTVYDIEKEQIKIVEKDNCNFAYRDSIFKQNNNLIILSAILMLEKGEKEALQQKVLENINWRRATFPENMSPGSFFKHTEPTEHNLKKLKEIPRFFELKMHEKNTIPTGFVIEECGLKGKRIGGAMISEKHANFIINTGDATAEDVIMLASFIKQQVRDTFGVELREEIQLVGF